MATNDTNGAKPKQTLEQRIAAMIAKEAKKNAPKADKPAAAAAQPRVKGRDISKAVAMLEKGNKMIADALDMLNQKEEKSEEYLANEAKYPEVPGAFFNRKANGEPKAPSGKQATDANKAAFAKAYPSLVQGYQKQADGRTKKVPMPKDAK